MFDIIESGFNLLIEKLSGWLETFITMLPNLLLAVLILTIASFIARLAQRGLNNLLGRISNNVSINRLAERLIYFAVLSIGVFIALGVLNLDKTVTSLLAGAGIIGLALGFAFQDTAANFISGVIMAFKGSFAVGELIETEGQMGTVERITLRSTQLRMLSGEKVIVPNKSVLQNPLKNYNCPHRRVELEVGVSYNDDLARVEKMTCEALAKLDFVYSGKPIELYYHEFGGSSINFTVRFWIAFQQQSDYLKAKSEAIKTIKVLFDKENISIPFPMRTLELSDKQDLIDAITSGQLKIDDSVMSEK